MRPYYFHDVPGDIHLPHDSGIPVDIEIIAALGLHDIYVPVPEPVTEDWPEIDVISRERGYIKRGFITVSKEALAAISTRQSSRPSTMSEHMHEEEEIRYVVQGSGYFDIREHPTDKWIRCALSPGDLMVDPAGIYHCFILDDKNMIKAMMLFTEEPWWSYYNRGDTSEANSYRLDYLKSIKAH